MYALSLCPYPYNPLLVSFNRLYQAHEAGVLDFLFLTNRTVRKFGSWEESLFCHAVSKQMLLSKQYDINVQSFGSSRKLEDNYFVSPAFKPMTNELFQKSDKSQRYVRSYKSYDMT